MQLNTFHDTQKRCQQANTGGYLLTAFGYQLTAPHLPALVLALLSSHKSSEDKYKRTPHSALLLFSLTW